MRQSGNSGEFRYLFDNGRKSVNEYWREEMLLSDFTYWSCHLFLYNEETLAKLVEKANYRINKIEQIQRYPLSNHLYWLAEGKAGGHKIWDDIDSKEVSEAYVKRLTEMKRCDTIICSISPL